MRLGAARRDDTAAGWIITAGLCVTVTTSYGVLMYAFPVMLVPMQVELGWSQALLTGGFSAAALASGVAAIPIGRWVDRHGPRVVMTAGSVLAVALLLAWSQTRDPLGYVLVWTGLGACMAALFYEPAFTVVIQWLHAGRARALTIITLAGGLASTVFVPLAAVLVDVAGWRGAVVRLAVTLGVLTIPVHALLLRHRPGAHAPCDVARGALPPSPRPAAQRAVPQSLRSVTFRRAGLALFLSTLASFALAIHLVPLLLERGFPATTAATALAALGLAKLPGRMLVAPLAGRTPAHALITGLLGLQAVALAAFCASSHVLGLWVFLALFGAGDGAATPARAELLAELCGPPEYGRISGILAFVLSLARAAAPIGGTLGRGLLGYDGTLLFLLALVSAAAVVMAGVRVQAPMDGATGESAASFHAGPRPSVRTQSRSLNRKRS